MCTHPKGVKGKGKPDKGGSKGGKHQRSNSISSRNGKGEAGRGKGKASPRGKTITDMELLCKNYLKGTCDKTDCKCHHNGPCIFHAKGNCNKGADCVFSHHVAPAAAAVVAPTATAEPKAKKKDDEDA